MKIPYLKDAVKNLFKPSITEKYPFVKIQTPENFRGKIKFDDDKCIGCGMCIRVCSPAAITKSMENVEGGQKITMHFDMGSCTFCQMCADFCPKKAIELTGEYSMVTTDKSNLFIEGTFVKKLPPKPAASPIAAPKATTVSAVNNDTAHKEAAQAE